MRVKNDESDPPIMIVGNKKDLDDKRQVTAEEASALAAKLGVPYLETSALTQENVDKVQSFFLLIHKTLLRILFEIEGFF